LLHSVDDLYLGSLAVEYENITVRSIDGAITSDATVSP
jgi:hypothetical protein